MLNVPIHVTSTRIVRVTALRINLDRSQGSGTEAEDVEIQVGIEVQEMIILISEIPKSQMSSLSDKHPLTIQLYTLLSSLPSTLLAEPRAKSQEHVMLACSIYLWNFPTNPSEHKKYKRSTVLMTLTVLER